jgi:hypothetical protein
MFFRRLRSVVFACTLNRRKNVDIPYSCLISPKLCLTRLGSGNGSRPPSSWKRCTVSKVRRYIGIQLSIPSPTAFHFSHIFFFASLAVFLKASSCRDCPCGGFPIWVSCSDFAAARSENYIRCVDLVICRYP